LRLTGTPIASEYEEYEEMWLLLLLLMWLLPISSSPVVGLSLTSIGWRGYEKFCLGGRQQR